MQRIDEPSMDWRSIPNVAVSRTPGVADVVEGPLAGERYGARDLPRVCAELGVTIIVHYQWGADKPPRRFTPEGVEEAQAA